MQHPPPGQGSYPGGGQSGGWQRQNPPQHGWQQQGWQWGQQPPTPPRHARHQSNLSPEYLLTDPWAQHQHLGQRRKRQRRTALFQLVAILAVAAGAGMALLASGLDGGRMSSLDDLVSGNGEDTTAFGEPATPDSNGSGGPAQQPPADPGDPGAPAAPGSPQETVEANPVYEVGGVAEIDCPAPPLDDLTREAQEAYYEQVFGCLNDAWQPLLADAGYPASDADLFVFDGPGNSPCGSFEPQTDNLLAFYCPANNMMYADVQQMAEFFPAEHHVVYALVLAHEYGHHVQNVTQILAAENQLRYEDPDQTLELSRRTEVQASCFAGMFIRGIAASYPVVGEQAEIFERYAYNSLGDPPDVAEDERTHGHVETQGRWIETGFTENTAGSCNSYVAAASEVE